MSAAAPRTWFAPRAERDADQEAWLALGAVMVLLAAPVAVLGAAVVYGAGRLLRWRWWWPVLTALGLAALVSLLFGPERIVDRYGAGYERLFVGGLDPGALASGWPALLGALAPASLPVAGVAGGLALGYAELRRPAWREEGRASTRRAARTRKRLERGDGAADGHLVLGVDVEGGGLVHLSEADLGAHCFVAGASRSGKTTALVALARAGIGWGRGMCYVDLKGDPAVVERLRAYAHAAGRPFSCWSLDGGASWDPLAHGDPSELKDKLVGLESWSEPHYRRAAERSLQLVFRAFAAAGERPGLAEVVAALDLKQVAGFARRLPEAEGDALCAYAESLPADQRSAVAGLATRLALLSESTAGPFLVPGEGTVDLRGIAEDGAVVVFSLDSGRWPGLAAQMGALVVQDLKAVCGAALQGGGRRWYVVIDEASALEADQLLGLFARAAAAGCSVTVATQELVDLDRMAAGFRDQVLGNTALKLCLRQDVPASAELWAEMAGTEASWAETIQTAHRSATPLSASTGQATGMGSLRRVESFVVHPNVIKRLPQGRCLLLAKHPRYRAHLVDIVIPEGGAR